MWNVSISVSMSEVVKAKASTSGTKANAWTLESKVSSPKDKTKKIWPHITSRPRPGLEDYVTG